MHPEHAHIGSEHLEDRVIEEASELILAIAKAKRFGWFGGIDYIGKFNYQAVLDEIEDCRRQFKLLEDALQEMVDQKNIIDNLTALNQDIENIQGEEYREKNT